MEKIVNLPKSDSNPQASHIQKLIPTEPVRTSKPDGDTKIPDPKWKKRREKILGKYLLCT